MRYRLRLQPAQECYYCSDDTKDFGLVANDDLQSSDPLMFAVCRSCALRTGLATDDEELRVRANLTEEVGVI